MDGKSDANPKLQEEHDGRSGGPRIRTALGSQEPDDDPQPLDDFGPVIQSYRDCYNVAPPVPLQWFTALRRKIYKRWWHLSLADRFQQATISFSVRPNGEIFNVVLASSSGSKIIDDAAMRIFETVTRTQRSTEQTDNVDIVTIFRNPGGVQLDLAAKYPRASWPDP